MSVLVNGKDVILSVHDGTEYRPVACLTSNSISESQDTVQSDPNKCDTSTTVTRGRYSYEVTGEGQFLDPTDPQYGSKASYEWLHDQIALNRQNDTNMFWKMGGGNTTDMFGEGIITSLELTAPADGKATFSFTLSGIGDVSKTSLA